MITRPPPKRSFASRIRSQSAALTLGTRGKTHLKAAYIDDLGSSGVYRLNTAAHEIGHIFNLRHPDVNRLFNRIAGNGGAEPLPGDAKDENPRDKERLMYGNYHTENENPKLLLHFEWNVINP